MFDAYLKIDTIPGECTDDQHVGWIQLLSFSHGVSQPHAHNVGGGGAKGGVARCDHQDFAVSKYMDKSSPALYLHCCNGVDLGTVKIELCRQADTKLAYMKYEFETCLISSVSAGGSSGGGLAVENVSFTYAKIKWTYTPVKPDTNEVDSDVMSYWDMLLNKGG